MRVRQFWSNNYIENESNDDRSKTLSAEEYLNKIRPYLKDIINNLKTSDTLEIQLTIENNIAIIINDEADEVIKELFDLLKNRYKKQFEINER